jgi:sulfur carrier protein ThiS
MRVTVLRRGRLAEGGNGLEETVALVDGAGTTDLLAACDVDRRTCIVVLNGVAVPHGSDLSDGDRVQLYPAQAGG